MLGSFAVQFGDPICGTGIICGPGSFAGPYRIGQFKRGIKKVSEISDSHTAIM